MIKAPIHRLLMIVLVGMLPWHAAQAETPEEKGLAIAREADARDQGYGDFVATMRMTLIDKRGRTSVRELRIKNKEGIEDGDKSLTIFDTPKDVAGTALLTWSHKVGDDDQWLYLPALARVKRIASKNKSGPFMGSEFAFEDMTSKEVEKYDYKYLRDEVYNGMDCFVVESYPKDKNSGYTKQVAWIDKEHYRTQKVDFYDRKHSHLKTLTISGYKQYLGKYWRPSEMFMENLQTGKKTKLEWLDYKFGNGLTDEDFTENSLKRLK